MVGLPSDTARAGKGVKAAYRQVLEMMAGAFEANLPPAEPPRGNELWRWWPSASAPWFYHAIDDPTLAEHLRSAARVQVLTLSGWGQSNA